MSQEKVAKYKEQKANRKETMKKQKRAKLLRNSLMSVIFVAVIGWVGYSAVDFYLNNRPRETVEVDYEAVDNYIEGLSKEAEKTEEK